MNKDSAAFAGRTAAEKSEWQRLIENNKALHSELREIRERYYLGNVNRSRVEQKEWSARLDTWLGRMTPEEDEQFRQELEELRIRHQIHNRWTDTIWQLAMTNNLDIASHDTCRREDVVGVRAKDGTFKVVLSPEADLGNKITMSFIESVLRGSSKPPRPQPFKENPRKLDWRPVWEWRKRYPHVSVTELAKMLKYTRPYVERKLDELDTEGD